MCCRARRPATSLHRETVSIERVDHDGGHQARRPSGRGLREGGRIEVAPRPAPVRGGHRPHRAARRRPGARAGRHASEPERAEPAGRGQPHHRQTGLGGAGARGSGPASPGPGHLPVAAEDPRGPQQGWWPRRDARRGTGHGRDDGTAGNRPGGAVRRRACRARPRRRAARLVGPPTAPDRRQAVDPRDRAHSRASGAGPAQRLPGRVAVRDVAGHLRLGGRLRGAVPRCHPCRWRRACTAQARPARLRRANPGRQPRPQRRAVRLLPAGLSGHRVRLRDRRPGGTAASSGAGGARLVGDRRDWPAGGWRRGGAGPRGSGSAARSGSGRRARGSA